MIKMSFNDFVIPLVIGTIIFYALCKNVNVFDEFITGAKENLKTSISVLPALMALMTAIGMFKASGALDILTNAISPLTSLLGFPSECLPLALIRPVSGSGALAIYENLLSENGANSFPARVASVLMGSTETTFYTIAVYYSVTKVKKTRHTLVCSLAGDITGFLFSVLAVRFIFG